MPAKDQGKVARHPERASIEAALVRGVPLRVLSQKYGVGRSALARHRKAMKERKPQVFAALAADSWKVTPEKLEEMRVEMSENWLAKLRTQFDKSEAMQDRAIAAGNFNAFAQCGAQVRHLLIEIGRACGQIQEAARFTQINNFILSPSFLRLKYGLLRALREHPEAKGAILAVLAEIEAAPMDTPPAGGRLPNSGQFRIIDQTANEQPPA